MKKCYLRIIALAIGSLIVQPTISYAQGAGQCPNVDFSMGNYTNWTQTRGRVSGTAYIGNWNNSASYGNFEVITTPGNDPNTCGNLPMIPQGFNQVARLNYANISYSASKIEYNITVTPQNALFVYHYAVIFGAASGHSATTVPWFIVRVLDQNNNLIHPCTQYNEVYPGSGYQQCGGNYFKPWSTIGVDLSPYIGQTVKIEVSAGSCNAGATNHWGYAYFAAECQPLQIQVRYCQGDNTATIIGPPGFQHQWSTGETTDTIYVNPSIVTSVTDVITSSSGCIATLTANVELVTVDAGFLYTPSCDLQVEFQDTTSANGASNYVNNWIWDFGDGNTSNLQNPSHTYNGPGTYTVKLVSETNGGCRDSLTRQVVIAAPDPLDLSYDNPVCINTGAELRGSLSSEGPSTTYEFTVNGNTFTPSTGDTTIFFTTPGNYNIDFEITYGNNCVKNGTFPISVYANPSLNVLASPLEICENGQVNFNANASITNPPSLPSVINNYQWNYDGVSGVDTSGSALNNLGVVYNNAGLYNVIVTVTTDRNCSVTDTVQIQVNSNPVAYFNIPNLCGAAGDVYLVDSSTVPSPYSFTAWDWRMTNNVSGFNQTYTTQNAFQQFSPTDTGTYNVRLIVTTDKGCKDTLNSTFTMFESPVAQMVYNGCLNLVYFTNQSTHGVLPHTFYWDLDGDGTVDKQDTAFLWTYPTTNDYTAIFVVEDKNGCRDTLDTLVKAIVPQKVPNVLNLQSTIGNEIFNLEEFAYCNYTLYIYNRWGNKVYEVKNDADNPDLNCDNCFRGKTFNGVDLSPGTYFYVLKGEAQIEYKGHLTIFDQ